MVTLGHFSLYLAWALALFSVVAGIIGGLKAWHGAGYAWLVSARRSTVLVCVATTLALAGLAYAFVVNDHTVQYVWQFSNRDMAVGYRISAIWGGMDGSMLLWCFILTVSGAVLAVLSSSYPRQLMPWVFSVFNSSSLFFLTVVVFFTNPFRSIQADFIPPDGNGLNPLLQNPYMAIHPPTLYTGFTLLAIPYAFCMGALLSGAVNNEWLRLTRRWTLVGWAFLTVGIMLGGHWAYIELGWGGFWAWDPVENASFMPWLTATAFLHSVMVQERKSMLKIWNVWLVTLSYALTVFGTFLTRSGVVQSVHAFASTDIGWVFLVYLGAIFALAVVLVFWRRVQLRGERQLESILSREAVFLLNNLVFLSIMFATLWGVMFPVLSEYITGEKHAVGIPFFNAVNVPLFLILIFLMAVGPLIAWRRASLKSVVRTFWVPFTFSSVVCLLLLWAGITEFYPLLSYGLSMFAVLTIMGEFHRGAKATKLSGDSMLASTSRLMRRHHSRYGGYIVHLGVALAAVSITASMAHKIEKDFTISASESAEIGRFSLKIKDIQSGANSNYEWLKVALQVEERKTGEVLTTLYPEKRYYLRTKEPTTEVALRIGLREDLYIALAGLDEQQTRVSFKAFVNPLQIWLWFGGIIMLFGTLIVLLPERKLNRSKIRMSSAISSFSEAS